MLFVCMPSFGVGAGAPWLMHFWYGGTGSPGATGEVRALWCTRQRRVAANFGSSSECTGTPTYRGSPTQAFRSA